MAERRMFAKTIIDSDAFLDMPLSTQALYFHLSMRADDEGFVGNPKKIQRMIGASDDDCKILISKRFILTFPSGIIVIKHWKIHNYLQTDRCKPTTYVEEKSSLTLDAKKAYTECIHDVYKPYTGCIQDVSKVDTQVRIGEDSIVKNNITPPPPINSTVSSRTREAGAIPTLEEVQAYADETKSLVDPVRFYDWYSKSRWRGVLDWREKFRQWSEGDLQEFEEKEKERRKWL